MESRIAKAIGLKHEPVAAIFTDDKPIGAKQFKEGKISCLILVKTPELVKAYLKWLAVYGHSAGSRRYCPEAFKQLSSDAS